MDLVTKYNIPVPRYTSYPTVPYWEDNLNREEWKEMIQASFKINNKNGISLYIHLPFCESLCTYCACNTRITVNHKVEGPYIDALIGEWRLYLARFNSKPLIKELHLGGGTPTFFSPENLSRLVNSILADCDISADHDFSFEGHPANTTEQHLFRLYNLGFKRVSFGVQDFDAKVQEAINRHQSFEQVKEVMLIARNIGYTSINIDLVYGLPYQSKESVMDSVNRIISLNPERVAFYSYAHVPWLKPGQRRFSEMDLPLDTVKRQLYISGRDLLLQARYHDIGMDHFALANDELLNAYKENRLHRNFMGYTASNTRLLIGLGCSAISDAWNAFSQNIKTVEEYQQAVGKGEFPVYKGHILSSQDLRIREHILNIMCRHKTKFYPCITDDMLYAEIKEDLRELAADNLIRIYPGGIEVTEVGRQFLRNICLAFDRKYVKEKLKQKIFSTTA
jgi:oxygen-independent coproporphyrinogen III oxidase